MSSNTGFERFLIVRLSSIGDTILSTPVLAAIKDAIPGATVDWVVGAKSRQIVEMCQGVERVFTFPKLLGASTVISSPRRTRELGNTLLDLRRQMAERHYDVAIDIQGLFKSGVATFVSVAPRRLGWRPRDSREMNWMFTNRWIKMRRDCHVVDCWRDLPASLGIELPPVRFPIVVPKDASEEISRYLRDVRKQGPVVVMNFGSSQAHKCWPAAKFAEVSEGAYREFGALSVYTWGNDREREQAGRAVELAGDAAAVLGPKTTLFTLAALVQQADAYVGPDTGPTHLAAALGTPVIGLYGVTNPHRLGPYGQSGRVVSAYSANGITPALSMDRISADDVYQKLAAVLKDLAQARHGAS